jgi:hypothetical protein
MRQAGGSTSMTPDDAHTHTHVLIILSCISKTRPIIKGGRLARKCACDLFWRSHAKILNFYFRTSYVK